MPKKIDDAEVKKECPSCGLGVALDSTICEFCGWDFDEEDEWILQIEKLERDLMLEKQKFEPGTFNEKVESTLHTPALEQQAAVKSAPKQVSELPRVPAPAVAKPTPPTETRRPAPSPPPVVERPVPAEAAPPAPAFQHAPERPGVEVQPAKVRRMRVVKSAPPQDVGEDAATRKKLVRKVKQ